MSLQVTLSPLDLHAECVTYMQQQVFTVDIENVGDTLATWRFVPKHHNNGLNSRAHGEDQGQSRLYEQWCSASPSMGMLSAGEVIGTAKYLLVSNPSSLFIENDYKN